MLVSVSDTDGDQLGSLQPGLGGLRRLCMFQVRADGHMEIGGCCGAGIKAWGVWLVLLSLMILSTAPPFPSPSPSPGPFRPRE